MNDIASPMFSILVCQRKNTFEQAIRVPGGSQGPFVLKTIPKSFKRLFNFATTSIIMTFHLATRFLLTTVELKSVAESIFRHCRSFDYHATEKDLENVSDLSTLQIICKDDDEDHSFCNPVVLDITKLMYFPENDRSTLRIFSSI